MKIVSNCLRNGCFFSTHQHIIFNNRTNTIHSVQQILKGGVVTGCGLVFIDEEIEFCPRTPKQESGK